MELEFVKDNGGTWTYRVFDKCVWCGYPWANYVEIPKPPKED